MAIIDKKITFAPALGVELNGRLGDETKTTTVYIRAYKARKYKYIPTGIYIFPTEWKNGQVIKHRNAREFNTLIRAHQDRLEEFQAQHLKKYGKITLIDLDRVGSANVVTFNEFFKQQIEKNAYEYGTKQAHQTTLNKLNQYFKRPLSFEEIDYKFCKQFEQFLRAENLHQNTIHKHFKNIRTHINEAIRYNYLELNRNPFNEFKVKKEKTYKIPLNEAELKELEQWTPDEKQAHLVWAKDFFLVCCYTALRFGDVAKLKPSDFFYTENGLCFKVVAQKTGKPITYETRSLFTDPGEVKSKLEVLLEKYLDIAKGTNFAFFKRANQPLNRALKEVFAAIPTIRPEIRDNVGTHYGRHTFATIMYQKYPLFVVSHFLQHSEEKTTRGYLNLTQDDINRALRNGIG